MMELDVRNLHPLEIKLLRHVSKDEIITANRLIDELDYNVGQCNQAFSWLTAKGFLKESSRKSRTLYEITPFGLEQHDKGTPAKRIFTYLKEKGPTSYLIWQPI